MQTIFIPDKNYQNYIQLSINCHTISPCSFNEAIQHAILLLSDRFTFHPWFPGTQSGKAHGQVFREHPDRPGVDFETKASKSKLKIFESSLFHPFFPFFSSTKLSMQSIKD